MTSRTVVLILAVAAGAVVLVGGSVFVILTLAVMDALEKANRVSCTSNLLNIGAAADIWASTHDQVWPDTYGPDSTAWNDVGNTRTDEFDPMGAAGLPPRAVPSDNKEPVQSNTASLWSLMASSLDPMLFVCPASEHHADSSVMSYGSVRDFRGETFVSYSYQNVLGGYSLNQRVPNPANLAVMADHSPLRRDVWSGAPGGVEEGPTDRKMAASPTFIEFEEAPPWAGDAVRGPWELNSPNHNFQGQNVLYLDNHVEWQEHPYCGPNGDNIWLKRKTDGPEPDEAGLDSLRAWNDTTSYDGASALPPDSTDDSFLVP
jgi:hypothetical protein